ncbi:hypothetical protein [Bradyrhizobium sp. 150]|uniref:hypothetical protein n=1 Tax=Bradyrhizobium sp. 150 TaxID=2782625 RepID=UPI001FFB0337|nr:hypothetical protein [Bradyrhizobium sp. 150]MCK1676597.1 hypothetical protein [Bradyrhizobium sp. 150]
MGSKTNPGQFDCYANALPDEPMFILLARDPMAPALVQMWAILRKQLIATGEKPLEDMALADEAETCAALMRAWRWNNEGKWRVGRDEGVDPTTADLLKPAGNHGLVDAEICFNSLLLIGDVDVTEELVASWTQDQMDRAYDWAMRVHLHASDNPDVFVPERPDFFPRFARTASADS